MMILLIFAIVAALVAGIKLRKPTWTAIWLAVPYAFIVYILAQQRNDWRSQAGMAAYADGDWLRNLALQAILVLLSYLLGLGIGLIAKKLR